MDKTIYVQSKVMAFDPKVINLVTYDYGLQTKGTYFISSFITPLENIFSPSTAKNVA